MKLVPLLVVTNALALAAVVVLFFQQQELESRLASGRASTPARTAEPPPEIVDARLERVERELALRPAQEAPAPPQALPEGSSEPQAAPEAPEATWGGAGAPDLTAGQMEVFRKRVRRAGELNAQEDRMNTVLESVDRLVTERKIAPLSPAQRTKAAETILAVRDKAPAIFRKFWTDPGFRELPEEQRRASIRAEVDTLRSEAQKALEEVLPAADAKTLIEETSRGFDGPMRGVPFIQRERPQ
jgi:hypothetical protein